MCYNYSVIVDSAIIPSSNSQQFHHYSKSKSKVSSEIQEKFSSEPLFSKEQCHRVNIPFAKGERIGKSETKAKLKPSKANIQSFISMCSIRSM